jgi:hypothetical protein
MQQDGTATAAGKVHRMLARFQHGRSLQDDAGCWRGNYFKGNTSGHDALPDYRRERDWSLRHRRLGRVTAGDLVSLARWLAEVAVGKPTDGPFFLPGRTIASGLAGYPLRSADAVPCASPGRFSEPQIDHFVMAITSAEATALAYPWPQLV